MRQSIYDNVDEYISIVEDPNLKNISLLWEKTFWKPPPKVFPKDFKYIDYLKCKEYTCSYHVPDDFFLKPDFLDKTEDVFRQFQRFADLINYTIDDFE